MAFMNRIIPASFWIVLFCTVLAVGQESNPPSEATLTISGEIAQPLKLGLADLAKLPRLSVQAKSKEGHENRYEGVVLVEVLKHAEVKFGEDLRGKALAQYLLVEATEGYRVVFALPELDSAFTARVILLADRKDGNPLPASEGPLRIVIPDEKRHSRWIRQVNALIIRGLINQVRLDFAPVVRQESSLLVCSKKAKESRAKTRRFAVQLGCNQSSCTQIKTDERRS